MSKIIPDMYSVSNKLAGRAWMLAIILIMFATINPSVIRAEEHSAIEQAAANGHHADHDATHEDTDNHNMRLEWRKLWFVIL